MKNSNNLAIEEFETIRPKLKSYLFRITAHKEDTEDLLQETYIKVSDNLLTFQKKSSLKTWIFAIATNLAKDYLRTKTRWLPNNVQYHEHLMIPNLPDEERGTQLCTFFFEYLFLSLNNSGYPIIKRSKTYVAYESQ